MGIHLFVGYFIGAALAAVLSWRIGYRRRTVVEPEVWWALLVVGFTFGMWSAFHSTLPSFAPRVTAVSTVSSCTEVREGKSALHPDGRNTKYILHLDQAPGGPIYLETGIVGPMCWLSSGHSGNIYRIVYLDKAHGQLGEAIAMEVLAGPDKGWHSQVDARPLGVWLGIPVGATLGLLGLFGLNLRTKDFKKCRIEDKRALRRSAR